MNARSTRRIEHNGDVGCPPTIVPAWSEWPGLKFPGMRRTTNPGIIRRIAERGRHSRFVVTLPEADSYREQLEDAIRIDSERKLSAEILAGITFENEDATDAALPIAA